MNMESSNLSQIQNQYPSLENYKNLFNDKITLFGKYNSNKLEFPLNDINQITPIEGTKFAFVILIKENTDSDGIYFTSEYYYNKLKESISTNNPYFLNYNLKDELILNLDLTTVLSLFSTFKDKEELVGVEMLLNNFMVYNENTDEYSISYENLVRYIDWVVSEVNPINIEVDSVLPIEAISDYTLFNTEVSSEEDDDEGTGDENSDNGTVFILYGVDIDRGDLNRPFESFNTVEYIDNNGVRRFITSDGPKEAFVTFCAKEIVSVELQKDTDLVRTNEICDD